jgi:hypothetical protein
VPKVGLDLRRAALAMKMDEALNLVEVSMLDPQAVAFDAGAFPDDIEETASDE